jgi:hypothetical protein
MSLIHSSFYKPRVFPYAGTLPATQIDRLQDLTGTISLNRDKIKEVGRDGTVGYKPSTPQASVTLRQLEYGSLDFWRYLANAEPADITLTHNEFKTSAVDITGYKTDDDGVFDGTVLYPKLRVNGFSLAIGDPDALIERNFTLIGEDEIIYQGNNKYYVTLTREVESGESGTITINIGGAGDYLNYPTPVADPDLPTKYFTKGTKQTGTTVTDLVEGTTFTYVNGTHVVSVPNCVAGDIIKLYYTASTYITGEDTFTNNDVDLAGISADSCSLYLNVGTYAYEIQSASMDVSFERTDQKEIGNKEVIARGIKSRTITIQLGRTLGAGSTIEEILRGVANNYGKIDARRFADDVRFGVKIYSDNTKSTFLMGYEFKNLTPSNLDETAPVDDYVTRNVTLTGEEFMVTESEAAMGL